MSTLASDDRFAADEVMTTAVLQELVHMHLYDTYCLIVPDL